MGRVLVIEDDDRIGRLVTRALEGGGLLTERACSGTAGLDAALRRDFDLVVLDLMLPGLDGHEVLDRLRAQRPEQPVLVLSAVPEISARVAVLEAGAADFLGKPFAVAELVARVRARMRAAPAGDGGRWLQVGPVQLDLHRRRATVAGARVELPLREFLLLQHLMTRAGRPCSRDELLADVWGLHFDPGSNVVDVSVRRLRGRLDRPDRIETVRGVGYAYAVD
ncbi:response regulator transcription factor [Micromonospora auratinigra]|uniref:DNA-binding response regulator, OmpR family, contains REC and winged-helix (WHTH) domain n=1 Tax=Micromonospora auratinigra TaxID=261654 RepID=A0A1A8Z844_9ACTN|nr:response regulator transcription factor [Micromonospora auratinigra]SBT40039.1 DNA-binding response regulator, OmpR family, contains REC and winged-helix (wHTH) domain [Micromonospora auratinigra]